MKFFTTVSMVAMLVATPAVAEPMKPLLDELLASHPRIKMAGEQVLSSEASKTEAFSGFLPKLTATGSKGREKTDRSDLVPAGIKTTYSTTNIGVTASQNLFEGFKTQAGMESASAGIALAKQNLELTRQQITLEAAVSYLDVLRQKELTRLSLENQDTLKKQLHLEDERVQRGSGIAVDILQAKSRLQIAKERYSAFTGALNDAVSRFTQVYDKAPVIESMELPAIPDTQIPPTLDEAIKTAEAHSPTLTGSKLSADIAETTKTTTRANYYPSLDLEASSTLDDNQGGLRGEEQVDSIQLKASWQLFNGLSDYAQNKKAAHEYQAAFENSVYTQRKVSEEVRLAWSSLITSKDRAELLENAVNIAGEVYDARKRLRDVGSETALNVLDAENELFRAKIDAVAARYDYYNAVYRLLFAMGMLTPEKI